MHRWTRLGLSADTPPAAVRIVRHSCSRQFLQGLGASAVLPLLPLFLRRHARPVAAGRRRHGRRTSSPVSSRSTPPGTSPTASATAASCSAGWRPMPWPAWLSPCRSGPAATSRCAHCRASAPAPYSSAGLALVGARRAPRTIGAARSPSCSRLSSPAWRSARWPAAPPASTTWLAVRRRPRRVAIARGPGHASGRRRVRATRARTTVRHAVD